MYMLDMVSSGSSVRIFINPIESHDSWEDPEGLIRAVCQSTVVALIGFYILGNLMIPEQLLTDCQSTKKCCNTCLILLPHDDDDDDVALAFVL
jgi:hypothetical protein